MGLDNGIILKLSSKRIPEDFTKTNAWWMSTDEDVAKDGNLDICYWRKCWGIRAAILGVLHVGEGCEHPVEAEDLPAIRRELVKFLNPTYWEENGDSIWTYEEIYESLLDDLLNLKWLERYLKKHPEDSAFFYDSY